MTMNSKIKKSMKLSLTIQKLLNIKLGGIKYANEDYLNLFIIYRECHKVV